jgi:tRNA pseudouridine55 synthase
MVALDSGIHLLHKPAGPTSFSLVQPFLADARGRKPRLPVCHGGALDPFADGLLPILVGRATRVFELLHPIPKEYEAEVAWGAETDNGDPLGTVVARGDASALDPGRLEHALQSVLGWREQVPPATSNKRVGGERAYVRAHRGEEVELPPVRVYLTRPAGPGTICRARAGCGSSCAVGTTSALWRGTSGAPSAAARTCPVSRGGR